MSEKIKEKAREKIKMAAAERGIFEKKKFWIGLGVLLCSYFGFAPAPANCENFLIVGMVNSLVRNLFQLGFTLLNKNVGKGFVLGLLRGMTQPTVIVDGVEHSIINLEQFQLHVFRPVHHSGHDL